MNFTNTNEFFIFNKKETEKADDKNFKKHTDQIFYNLNEILDSIMNIL